MAQCRYCDRKGWLLSVDSNGLCSNCVVYVIPDISQRVRIINESAKIVSTSTNKSTRLSRCDLIIQHARELQQYELKGIPTMEPFPSAMIPLIEQRRRDIIEEDAQAQVTKWLDKADTAATTRTKLTNASKALLAIREARKELDDPSVLAVREREVKTYLHETEYRSYLAAAEKAEFKGNRKKALDQYQEALFMLKKDATDDAFQSKEIAELETKIAELSG